MLNKNELTKMYALAHSDADAVRLTIALLLTEINGKLSEPAVEPTKAQPKPKKEVIVNDKTRPSNNGRKKA